MNRSRSKKGRKRRTKVEGMIIVNRCFIRILESYPHPIRRLAKVLKIKPSTIWGLKSRFKRNKTTSINFKDGFKIIDYIDKGGYLNQKENK